MKSLQAIISNALARFHHRDLMNIRWKNHFPKILLFLVVIVVIAALSAGVLRSNVTRANDARIEVRGALATVAVGKTLQIPVLNDKGKVATNVTYTIENAELRDEIIVQGRRMVAIKGRVFLVLTIKLVNEYNKELEIKAADYVRLAVSGNEKELLAPDIHNDPVRVQAISTKYTRVGFPVYDTQKNLVLFVGSINEEKEKIPLQF